MTSPKLRIAASGWGGSGYKNPFTGEKVVGVTTALGAIAKPGVVQWAVDQTAAYAVVNAESLLTKTEEQGFRGLRWYTRRAKESNFDDPEVDIHNYHAGVLDDAAQMGNFIHEHIEADILGDFGPTPFRHEHDQMIEAYEYWKSQNDVDFHATETTLFGVDYGGTADWNGTINGVRYCGDTKSSRNTWNEHYGQLAALGAATSRAIEVPKGTPGAAQHKSARDGVSWWVEDAPLPFTDYAILHVRPDDYNSKGEFVPAFCELKPVSHAKIEAGWQLFQAAKAARFAQNMFKEIEKGEG